MSGDGTAYLFVEEEKHEAHLDAFISLAGNVFGQKPY
jgi:hypothetical protein